MIKYICLFFSVIFLFSSCNSISDISKDIKKLEGKYVQKDAKWIQLHFVDDDFIFLDISKTNHIAVFECCDTISFGSWKIDSRGFVLLNSPKKFRNNSFIDIKVSEEQGNSTDSLYFIINNPIEKHYRETQRKRGDLIYKVLPGADDINFTLSYMDERHQSNKFSIYKGNNTEIRGFEIAVLVDPEIKLTKHNIVMLKSNYYDIKDSNANVFKINIPDLTFQYLTHKRLKDDYVKIINGNKLFWDGKEYIRKK